MQGLNRDNNRRVLIASSHSLFGQGLRSMLQSQQKEGVEVVGVVSSLEEATDAIERLSPDLVIVDYDDNVLNRSEFLACFVEGDRNLRMILLSLQGSEEALVYDRRTLAASQVDDWLKEWVEPGRRVRPSRKRFGPEINAAARILSGRERRNKEK